MSGSSVGRASTGHQRTSRDSSLTAGSTSAPISGQEAHVEVLDGAARVAELHRVLGEVQRLGPDDQSGEPGLLGRLPQRRPGQGRVAGLEVAAEVEPLAGLAVQVEQDLTTVVTDHQRTGREVGGEARAREAVLVGVQVLDVRGRAAGPAPDPFLGQAPASG